jgi:GxxExxY protein
MKENDIAKEVVRLSLEIHKELGSGFLESVYEFLLFQLLTENGFNVQRQVSMPIYYRGKKLDLGYKADLLVENLVIIELKSVEKLAPIHFKQVLNYLKASNLKLGLLINFNSEYIKYGIKRVVNNL